MKISEIRSKKDSVLKEELIKLRKEKMNMRFQAVAGELKSPVAARLMRKDIARMKTVINERANGAKNA